VAFEFSIKFTLTKKGELLSLGGLYMLSIVPEIESSLPILGYSLLAVFSICLKSL
jgi:hypothetical protein